MTKKVTPHKQKKGEKFSNKHFVAIDKRLFSVTKKGTVYRSKRQKKTKLQRKERGSRLSW